MPVNKKGYIIVNIWTSKGNKALPGVNVGHASLTTPSGHICLWPENGDNYKPKSPKFFNPSEPKPKNSYLGAKPGYQMDYEKECMRETECEDACYALSLLGYELCDARDDSDIGENKLYVSPAYAYSLSLTQTRLKKDTVYLTLSKNGSLQYTAIDSQGKTLVGTIDRAVLENINPELINLTEPLTTSQLELIEPYYSDLLDAMPENHRVVLGEVLLQYTVRTPFGKEVTEKIKEPILLDNGLDLLDALLTNQLDADQLQLFLPALLDVTLKKGHTRSARQEQVIEKDNLYVALKEDGSLQYTVIPPGHKQVKVTGTISSELLKGMRHRGKSLELKAPLTRDQLPHLEQFLFNILEETSKKEHTRRMRFRPVSHRDELYEDDTVYRYDQAMGYEPCLMPDADDIDALEEYKVYFTLTENEVLQYRFKTPCDKTISDEIDGDALQKAGCRLKMPLTMHQLNHYFLKIMNVIKERGHLDTNKTYEVWKEAVPPYVNERYSFMAIKMIKANFRMVLYSLKTQYIEAFFRDLKKDGITGWTLQGSNMFTRAFGTQTTENCSSLVYRCLNAGGLFEKLSSQVSSQVSSVVTPDDLLRCIVAAKERELNFYSETRHWNVIEDESSVAAIKSAYTQVGANANCEDSPNIIPTNPSKKCPFM